MSQLEIFFFCPLKTCNYALQTKAKKKSIWQASLSCCEKKVFKWRGVWEWVNDTNYMCHSWKEMCWPVQFHPNAYKLSALFPTGWKLKLQPFRETETICYFYNISLYMTAFCNRYLLYLSRLWDFCLLFNTFGGVCSAAFVVLTALKKTKVSFLKQRPCYCGWPIDLTIASFHCTYFLTKK